MRIRKIRKPLLFIVGVVHILSCGMLNKVTLPKQGEEVSTSFEYDGRRTFKNCSEIESYLQTTQGSCGTSNRPCPVAIPSLPQNSPESGSTVGSSERTSTQVSNVDESDAVKVNENFIFVARQRSISVIDRETNLELGVIDIPSPYIAKMYVSHDLLTLVNSLEQTTQVRTYQLQAHKMPTVKNTREIAGLVKESRMHKDELLLLTSQSLQSPLKEVNGAIDGIQCSDIIVPFLRAETPNTGFLPTRPSSLLRVTSLDLSKENAVKSAIALLDDFRNIYVTESIIILSKDLADKDETNKQESTVCSTSTYGCSCSDGTRYFDTTHLAVLRYNHRDSPIRFEASGEVPGRIKDKWAFKQFADQNRFFLGTTTHESGGLVGSRMSSSMYKIEIDHQKLSIMNQADNIAPNEEIRAIRYVDQYAYVITFKKADPLFVFDLKDDEAPNKIGEVTVPGFSSMLYPLNDKDMLGVGFDAIDDVPGSEFARAEGIQFSLFDVSNKVAPKLSSFKIQGARGSSSEATFDHHSLFHDVDAKIVAAPLVEFDMKTPESSPYDVELKFSGSVFYAYAGNQLSEVARVTHEDIMPDECKNARKDMFSYWWGSASESFDVRRILKLDGDVFTVSPFGVKVLSNDLQSERSVIRFGNAEAICDETLKRYVRKPGGF